jgi:hypothetical protein
MHDTGRAVNFTAKALQIKYIFRKRLVMFGRFFYAGLDN